MTKQSSTSTLTLYLRKNQSKWKYKYKSKSYTQKLFLSNQSKKTTLVQTETTLSKQYFAVMTSRLDNHKNWYLSNKWTWSMNRYYLKNQHTNCLLAFSRNLTKRSKRSKSSLSTWKATLARAKKCRLLKFLSRTLSPLFKKICTTAATNSNTDFKARTNLGQRTISKILSSAALTTPKFKKPHQDTTPTPNRGWVTLVKRLNLIKT